MCPLCQHAVLVKSKNCNREPELVGAKEYIGEGLGCVCFLQGRGTNNGPNDGNDRDGGDDGYGDGREECKPTALGWFLLLNPIWTTLDKNIHNILRWPADLVVMHNINNTLLLFTISIALLLISTVNTF